MELRARELLAIWQYYRRALPIQLVDGLTNLRNAMRKVDGDPAKQYTRTSQIIKPPVGG